MIICFKTSVSINNIPVELFLFEEVIKNYKAYQACLVADENAIINNLDRVIGNCEFQFKRLRYRFFDLHSNLTAIFCLIITYILLKNMSKKFLLFHLVSLVYFFYISL